MSVPEGTRIDALLLAGKRDGELDPLAAAAGVTHKCLVPVHGRAMIEYPLEALAHAPGIGRIWVCIDDPAAIMDLPLVRRFMESGRLRVVMARLRLVDSIVAAGELADFPLLITAADNVLLTGPAVQQFADEAQLRGADGAVAFATEQAVRDAHGDGQRRFYRFSCGSYSNCNLYLLRSREALGAAEAFRTGGQFAKHPARVLQAFGLLNLIRFRLGIGTLESAFLRLSRRFRLRLKPIVLDAGQTAIDVDNARTKGVAEEILLRGKRELEAA